MTPGQAKAIHIQIDPHSGVPVYRQVMDQIRYYVASGVLRAGEQLPSIRTLARKLSVNPATVVKAYSELQHAGAIVINHGKGAFVSDSAGGMSDAQRKKALRRTARQLAIEALQMGAGVDLVRRIVAEEMEKLEHE